MTSHERREWLEASERWACPLSITDRYEVSDLGRVRRTRKYAVTAHELKVLKQYAKSRGYLQVRLSLGARSVFVWACVHRLVADAFHGARPKGMEINHIDGCKVNNRASNLEYVTARQNKDHAIRLGLTTHGESNCKAKLTLEDVLEIRKLVAAGMRKKLIAVQFGVHRQTILRISTGENWGREEYASK